MNFVVDIILDLIFAMIFPRSSLRYGSNAGYGHFITAFIIASIFAIALFLHHADNAGVDVVIVNESGRELTAPKLQFKDGSVTLKYIKDGEKWSPRIHPGETSQLFLAFKESPGNHGGEWLGVTIEKGYRGVIRVVIEKDMFPQVTGASLSAY